MARREDWSERLDVAVLEGGNRRADAFVLGLDVSHAARVGGFELPAPVGVARSLVRVALAGVEHEDRDLVR